MLLRDYLEGMRLAQTAEELETAIQQPYRHAYHGRTWNTVCKVRIESGEAICKAHPLGDFVPRLEGNQLIVCGERMKVGRGMNSSGIRYVWHEAGCFAKDVLTRNGITTRAASRIWEGWRHYPHRCLAIVEAAQKGEVPDPQLDTMIRSSDGLGPVNITVEENNAEGKHRRATQPCECSGTLFDWGAGYSDGFTFVKWHCNACSRVYTEYVSRTRFAEIRNPAAQPA